MFLMKYNFVYSLLEGFRISLQVLTSCGILHMVEFFKHTLFFKPIFENPTHLRAVGWATMPCMLFIENHFKHVHEMGGWLYEVYT